MNTVGIVGWSLAGLIVTGCLRLAIQRFNLLPAGMSRLAPPGVPEVATAVLFAALAWRIGAEPVLPAYCWLATSGVMLATIDWSSRELPTRLVWPAGTLLAALLVAAAAANHDLQPLVRAATGMLILLAFYGTIYFLRPGQLGGGDLRLGGLLGLALGWTSWTAIVMGTLVGWLAAATAVLAVRIVRRAEHGLELPLGPFLVIGAFIAILAGSTI